MSGANSGRRVGIKDVAERAGVSITTVSHALSGKGRLPDATRRRVQEVARELGYTPDPTAQSLARGRSGLVATVVSSPGSASIAFTEIDYYVALMNAATRTAVARGYPLVIAPSTAGADTWDRLPLDGVIVIDPAHGDAMVPLLRARGVAMVFVGRDPNGEPGDLVVQNDRRAGTTRVLDHLAEVGEGAVGMLTLGTFESFSAECLEAYGDWCEARGQSRAAHIAAVDSTADAATLREVAASFLDAPDRPAAVFCLYERLAIELLAEAHGRGLRVPDDLRIATISELGLAAATDPPLTTLDIEHEHLGEIAAGLLCDLLDGLEVTSVLDVPTELSIRASSAG
ncbi:MAG TPA: LacI family DNA-binding transcriptional regulator [Actinomycetota bacterium]